MGWEFLVGVTFQKNVYTLDAGGKPSTWFPPGGLVEFSMFGVSKISYKELTTHKKGPKVRLGVCPW